MSENYLLQTSGRVANTASFKAKDDINQILTQEGFFPAYFNTKLTKLKKLFLTDIMISRIVKKVGNCPLVIQYPLYSTYMTSKFLNKLTSRQTEIIFLVHDVLSLRNSIVDHESKKNEIAYFNQCNCLIVHNNKMKMWLKANGVTTPMVNLDIFDYLNPQPILNPKFTNELIFAGNLNKADFLQKINNEITINLYGPNKADSYPDSVFYKGLYSAEELPAHLAGSFGLVWDGDSVDECNGPYGEYLKYNNPHKTSLYLSSGLPVIVWKNAAIADFIVNNNLGLAVNSLNDINGEISKLSEDDYRKMLLNVKKIANKLRSGYFTKRAVDQAKMTIELSNYE